MRKAVEFLTAASALAVLCAGCSGPPDTGEDAAVDLTVIIPDVQSARFAAQDAIRALPGVEGVSSSYTEPTRVLEVSVYYKPVPDRWPFNEKVELAVRAAAKRYVAHQESIVRIDLVRTDLLENDPGPAED